MEEEREGTAKRERDIVTGGDGDGGRGGGEGFRVRPPSTAS